MRWGVLLTGALTLLGCTAEPVELLVDVKTDHVPGVEFVQVRSTVDPRTSSSASTEIDATLGQAYIAGARVDEMELEDAGSHVLDVALLDASGSVVATRRTHVEVEGTVGVTVLLTRSCGEVTCPGPGDPRDAIACVGGACVPPECRPEAAEACTVECTSDAECMPAASCADATCIDSACFQAPRPGACGPGSYCSIADGDCRPVPGTGCATSAECGPGEVCDDGACVPGCTGPGDCGAGEVCDDGACVPECTDPGDCGVGETCEGGACVAARTAFRVTSMALRDPGMFAEADVSGMCFCGEGTSVINDIISDAVDSRDANVVYVFDPLDPSAGSNPVDAYDDADCPSDSSCSPGSSAPVSGTARHVTTGDAPCLLPVGDTADAATNEPAPPCFSTDAHTIRIDLAGAPIDLEGARIGGTISGSPADRLTDGLLMGFAREADARDAELGDRDELCGGTLSLWDILPGGGACGGGDLRDDVTGDGEPDGWWLYFDVEAVAVDWSE